MSIRKYKVVLIEEGLGNLGNCFYYTRDALQYAAEKKVFEGKKCYADHPDAFEAKTRPERSVKDIIGHFQNIHIEDGQAGQAILAGELVIMPGASFDWARTLIESAVGFAGKFDAELIGLSINAEGESVKKSLDEVISDDTLPISVMPKLYEAQAEGITDVEWCTRLQDAVSCDLVTEAGARGRVQKILESENIRMKTKSKIKENEKSKEKEAEEKAKEAGKKDGEGSDHADADQDKELITSMLKKYLGDGEHPEEAHQAMKSAHDEAKAMGLEGEEAEKCAGYSMKMAKHAAEKQSKEEESKEGEEKESEEAGKEPPAKKDGDDDSEDSEDKKESKLESEVKKLRDENKKLAAKSAALELAEFVQKTVESNGFKGKLAQKFRESVQGVKSLDEVKRTAKVMREAISVTEGDSVYLNPEKSENSGAGKFSLAGCVKE